MVWLKLNKRTKEALKMQYELEIIDFDKDVRGFKIGTCDIKVKYSEEKWEIFRVDKC